MESVKLGVIADVQYCDRENGFNYERTSERFYRNSINHLDNAIDIFLANDCNKVLQLGDLIDGYCKTLQITDMALDLMSERFVTNKFETFHVVGNHELYNLSRENLYRSFIGSSLKKYQKNDQDIHYYKVNLTSDIGLIVLDCYEISILNRRDNDENNTGYLQGRDILTENNKNESWNEPNGAKRSKYVAFNGGVSKQQLFWLDQELARATADNQIIILAGHIPILSSSSNPLCLLWNNEEVMELVYKYRCVKAYFSGHSHIGNILKMKDFLHITMPGVIESSNDQSAYGILEITKEKLHLSALKGYWNDIIFHF